MKNYLLLLAILPLVGCAVGGVELTKEANFCVFEGINYEPGETVLLADGCNSCLCNSAGNLEACTEIDCAASSPIGLANPAAVKCSVDGFSYEIREDADGGQYGVCIDEENRECDAWEYFHDECVLGEAVVEKIDEPEAPIEEVLDGEIVTLTE